MEVKVKLQFNTDMLALFLFVYGTIFLLVFLVFLHWTKVSFLTKQVLCLFTYLFLYILISWKIQYQSKGTINIITIMLLSL